MRVKFQFVICLAMFCTPLSAQTVPAASGARMPTETTQGSSNDDARYYAQVDNFQFTVKVVDRGGRESMVVEPKTVANSLQFERPIPRKDRRTIPVVVEQSTAANLPIAKPPIVQSHSANRSYESKVMASTPANSQLEMWSEDVTADYLNSQFDNDKPSVRPVTLTQGVASQGYASHRFTSQASPSQAAASQVFTSPGMTVGVTEIDATPNYVTDPTPQNYDHPVTEIKNHLFFGVDREACCDEWADYCKCGGLKLNPGHLGLPWLRGNDPCECTECALRNYRNERRAFRGCKSANECSSCQTSGGFLGRVKKSKVVCEDCGQ